MKLEHIENLQISMGARKMSSEQELAKYIEIFKNLIYNAIYERSRADGSGYHRLSSLLLEFGDTCKHPELTKEFTEVEEFGLIEVALKDFATAGFKIGVDYVGLCLVWSVPHCATCGSTTNVCFGITNVDICEKCNTKRLRVLALHNDNSTCSNSDCEYRECCE